MTEFRNVYLLLGPENGEKKEFIDELRKKVTACFGAPPDEYSFYPYDTDASDIIAILRNISLFAPARIITVRNCHDLKKKDAALITDYLKKPADNSILILASDSTKVDPSVERAVPADSKKIFWEMFDSKKKGWVIQFFHREKIAIDNSAAEFLVDMLESDTETLKKECGNLALFFRADGEITEEKIADFFYSRKEENIFSLFNHIAAADLEKAVETSRNIFLSGESGPVQVLGGLLWQIRNLYELKKLLLKKKSFSEACMDLNIRVKKMQSVYSAASSNYSIEEIENIISLIASHDYLFRSSRAEIHQVLFPVFLYSVIVSRGRNIYSISSGAVSRFP